MKDETRLLEAGFFDDHGRLFTPGPINTWRRPWVVAPLLLASDTSSSRSEKDTAEECLLVLRGDVQNQALVNPTPDLLEKFLNLADAPLARIRAFAAKYGQIAVFSPETYVDEIDEMARIEYCEVWRYLARSMQSLLTISADFVHGREPSKGNWEVIERVPTAILSANLTHLNQSERRWRSLTILPGSPPRSREAIQNRLNTLLGMGGVRPWIQWPGNSRVPTLVYNSPGLFPHLALQLCLRVLRRETFARCSHCSREFVPLKRAPKLGQRAFCPDCRGAGIPQQYAKQNYRDRARN